jgi:hypothetical protein
MLSPQSSGSKGLAGLIAGAFRIRSQLLSGSNDSIEAMTERLGMDKGRIASLFRLSYLASGIVRALLEGRQPIELTPTRLRRLSRTCRTTGTAPVPGLQRPRGHTLHIP